VKFYFDLKEFEQSGVGLRLRKYEAGEHNWAGLASELSGGKGRYFSDIRCILECSFIGFVAVEARGRVSAGGKVKGDQSCYLVVWQFRPRAGAVRRFEEAYGSRGPWARLFAGADGFIGTELNRDLKDSERYLTIDFWTSKEAYESFRAKHATEYAAIDRECEALTVDEMLVGEFEKVIA